VFFLSLGIGFGGGSSKTTREEETSEAKYSVNQFGFGLGLRYFVDSNVALTTEFVYESGSSKGEDAEEATKFTKIHIAKIGFALFI